MNTSTAPSSPPIIPFLAESAADAVAQIRSRLGPDAVVVNVRQVPADGLAKLWKSARIEVLAYKPNPGPLAAVAQTPDPLAELKQELQAIRQQMGSAVQNTNGQLPIGGALGGLASARFAQARGGMPGWRVGEVLESSGMLPIHAQCVVERLQSRHGEVPPGSLAEELVMARAALSGLWRTVPEQSRNDAGPHVLVGPSGVGKTTCICKWLAQARLIEGRSAHVWRLDGSTANTAEALSVYSEILGVPVDRTWSSADSAESELNFIDLPGVDWRNSGAIHDLKRMVDDLGPCRVHLVLNAAYEVPLLLAQTRSFSLLPIEDLILTHLDEEPRWGKIWNVVLGTNYPVRFLSAAQNVPGEFLPATPERILTRQFTA